MKLSSLLCALLAWIVLAPAAHARSLEAIRQDGRLVIATEGRFAPFNYLSGGQLTGFEVELAEAVGRKLGLRVEWRTQPFDTLLPGLQQDRWDMVIASHGITPARAAQVRFTDPHYCTGGVIVSKEGRIASGGDLSGLAVSVQAGTSYQAYLEALSGVGAVRSHAENPAALDALVSGQVDAWVTDKFVAKEALSSRASRDVVRANLRIGGFLFVERVAAAVAHDNAALAEEINQALAALRDDGSYARLSHKYFREDIRCMLPTLGDSSVLSEVLQLAARQPGHLLDWVGALTAAMALSAMLALVAERLSLVLGSVTVLLLRRLMLIVLATIVLEIFLAALRRHFLGDLL